MAFSSVAVSAETFLDRLGSRIAEVRNSIRTSPGLGRLSENSIFCSVPLKTFLSTVGSNLTATSTFSPGVA